VVLRLANLPCWMGQAKHFHIETKGDGCFMWFRKGAEDLMPLLCRKTSSGLTQRIRNSSNYPSEYNW